MRKRIVLVTAILMLAFFTLACDIGALVGDDSEDDIRAEALRDPNEGDGDGTDYTPPGLDPDTNPTVTLEVWAEDPLTLPVFKAAMSHPIVLDGEAQPPQRATLRATRNEDYQALGGQVPGTVQQNAYFEGTWDPSGTGVLSGQWTFTYSVVTEATGDALASTAEYSMHGFMEAYRVAGTDRIEGTIKGPASLTVKNIGASEQPPMQSWVVEWTVSGELPEGF